MKRILIAAGIAAFHLGITTYAAETVTPAIDPSVTLPKDFIPTNLNVAEKTESKEDYKTKAIGVEDQLHFDFNVANATTGNSSVVRVERGSAPNSFNVVGLKKGTTSVSFLDDKGTIRKTIIYNITAADLRSRVAAVKDLLFDIEGITIREVEDKIVIDGELIVPRDLDRILAVSSAFPEILNLVQLSKLSRDAIAKRMQKEINDDPAGANVQVKIMNDTFFLLGKVDSSSDRERAEIIAQTYLPEIMGSEALKNQVLVAGTKTKAGIKNMIMVEDPAPPPPEKMVRVTYHFVEMGKNFLKLAFLKWAPLASDGGKIDFGTDTTGGVGSKGTFVGAITNLLPKLQSGANGGFARILFSTVGVGMSGKKISLGRTDNIPFISSSANGSPIQDNTQVQIVVDVTPTVQGEDKVLLDTSFTFTALSGAGAGGKPATTVTKLANVISLKSNDSAVLGGLISNDTSKDVDKDPFDAGGGSGASSAIFNILRSKAFRSKKTQFVVFLTPKIIADAAEGTADIKAKIISSNKKRQRLVQ